MLEYTAIELKKSIEIRSIVSIHYYDYTSDFSYPGESHDFWEIIYCDKGSLEITADNNRFNLNIGEAFLHSPMQYHNVKPANGEPASSIIFSFYSDCERLEELSASPLTFDSYARNALFSIINEAGASFDNPLGRLGEPILIRKSEEERFAAEQVICCSAEMLLINLIRNKEKSASLPEASTNIRGARLAEQISEYMKDNLSKKITFSDIAYRFSVSPTTLKKLFRNHYNSSTMEYLTSLRIERAKELLRGGKHTCTEISSLCGFYSIHHFSKVFKEKCGISPTEYLRTVRSMLDLVI